MTPLLAALLLAGPWAGGEVCARCHEREAREWDGSRHGRHAVPVAPAEEPFDSAVGSRWMQALFRRDGEGWTRILPRCYELRERRWREVLPVLREIRGDSGGWPESPPLTLEGRSFEADCAGCHSSRPLLRIDAGNGAMRSSYGSLAIDCEACHGPGAEHAEAWARKDASKAMPRLERMTPRERNALCGRCHGGPPASTDFAPSDAKHVIAPLEDRLGFGPDGSALGQIYQWPQFVRSPCYAKGGLTCSDCHESHSDALRHRANPDALCTRCHEGLADRAHTRHDPKGAGARCVECHMPRLLEGLLRHQRDHRISIPAPTPLAPDACTACHKGPVKAWHEAPRGTRDAIEAIALARRGERSPLLRAALLHEDPFFRANAARHLGEAPEDPSPEVRLAALPERSPLQGLADPEPLIRATAYVRLLREGVPVDGDYSADLEIAARLLRDAVEERLFLGLLRKEPRWIEEAIVFRPRDPALWLSLARVTEGERSRAAHGRRAEILRAALLDARFDVRLLEETIASFAEAGRREEAKALIERHALSRSERARLLKFLEDRP